MDRSLSPDGRWRSKMASTAATNFQRGSGHLPARSKNHSLDGPGLLKHHEEEALVRWAWQPGRRTDGTMRTLPPLTHEEFVAATRRWVDAGTPCPPGR